MPGSSGAEYMKRRIHMRVPPPPGRWVPALIGAFLFAAASGAMAETRFGVRAGASLDPDQFHFGGHIVTDPLIERLTFRPNLEIGVGDDITAVGLNFEFAFGIPIPKDQFSLYIGAGPALNIYRFGGPQPRNGNTDAEGGFNILFGLEHGNGLMGEFKVGAIESPEFKITIGYTFP
jgi:hypothetical protein